MNIIIKTNLFIIIFIIIVFIILIKMINFLLYIYKNDIKVGKNIINFIYIYNEIFNNEDYKLNINYDNFVIFDIGANMGLFSLWINENFKNTKVHLFEPIDELLDIAKYNLNNMKKNNNQFTFNNVGLSNNNYNDIIYYYYYANGLSTINDFNDKLKYLKITLLIIILLTLIYVKLMLKDLKIMLLKGSLIKLIL